MSNFRAKAFNPVSKKIEDAEHCDNYYGRHRYGIRFGDGSVHPEAQCGIDAAAAAIDALQARVKELEARPPLLDAKSIPRVDALVKTLESRALRLQQERDEAYERAAKIIDAECESILSKQTPTNDPLSMEDAVNQNLRLIAFILPDLAAAIRRLAGPEKEGE